MVSGCKEVTEKVKTRVYNANANERIHAELWRYISEGESLAGSMTLGIGDFQPSFPSSHAFRGVCVGGLPEMKQKPPY